MVYLFSFAGETFSKKFVSCETFSYMQGRFEILTLSGSYTISDAGGMRSRTGGLSVSLTSPDGRVIGGGVAGLLMAASPIQVTTFHICYVQLKHGKCMQKAQ